MDFYPSVEDLNTARMMNSIAAAKHYGLTSSVAVDGHVYMSRPDSMELVDIFPDGSWEYQDVKEDKTMRTMSGPNASMLSMYLQSDENKAIMEENQAELMAEEGSDD